MGWTDDFRILTRRHRSPAMRPILIALLILTLSLPAWAGYEDGLVAYENGDYAKALDIWMPLAEQDHARAQLSLGVLYEQGNGVRADPATAAGWYELSAKQGLAVAQFRLGMLYYDGSGVAEDPAKAAEWFGRAAVKGHGEAQLWIAFLYHHGAGVEKNVTAAAGWYKKAADQGMATAQFNLGTFYQTGTGVPQDTAKAATLYLTASNQGFADAQVALGRMFADGIGVRQDLVRAHKWLNLAASTLEPGKARDQIIGQREVVAKHLTPAQLAEAQRQAREWRPQTQ